VSFSDDPHRPTTAGPTPPTASFDGAVAAASSATEKPEVLIGAAFAGGFVTAMLLKRLGR
jgi:hypothetical protein